MADLHAPLVKPTAEANPDGTEHALDYHSTKHGGYDQVVALARKEGHKLSPARVAELIQQHPKDHHHIVEYLEKKFGHGYTTKVHAAMGRATRAEHVDLDMDKENPHHKSVQGNGDPDPNRLALHDHGHEKHGEEAKVVTPVDIYTNDGKPYPIGKTKVGQTFRMNAGGYKHLKLQDYNAGKETECVLGFTIHADTGQQVSGWVPAACLDKKVGGALTHVDKGIAKVDNAKAHAHEFSKHPKHVVAHGSPKSYADLRTAANQTGDANMPEHYFARPGNVVNLLSNVPGSGHDKFGVALDVVVEGTQFFETVPPLTDHVQLFKKASMTLTDQVITFVYGKTEKNGQAPSFGWINKDCLKG
jgi:hypothetical protein